MKKLKYRNYKLINLMSHQFVRFWWQVYWNGLPVPPPECQRIEAFKLWCWRRLLKVPWTARRANQSVLNQPWILIGRTDAEGEAPVFWSPDVNSWLTGKVPDAGKDRGQKEKRVSEDEMAGWHHWCTGHELGQTLGDGEGQGGLAYYSPWGYKELDMTGPLNNNNKHLVICN